MSSPNHCDYVIEEQSCYVTNASFQFVVYWEGEGQFGADYACGERFKVEVCLANKSRNKYRNNREKKCVAMRKKDISSEECLVSHNNC